MTRFKNVSPLGALDVPAIGRVVEADEIFEVRADVADLLIAQTENFAVVPEAKGPTVKELRAQAEAKGIELPAGATKPEIIAALAAHEPEGQG